MHVNACHTIFAASRNVTLALPEDLRRRMKSVAAKTDTSISALPGLNATLLRDVQSGRQRGGSGSVPAKIRNRTDEFLQMPA
jgi:hypothetical protein